MISRCDENSGTFEGVSNVILGVGIDAVEISRVQKSCEKEHFQNRVFTAAEIGQFDKRKVRAASDFAGKEAVVTGWLWHACHSWMYFSRSSRSICSSSQIAIRSVSIGLNLLLFS